MKIDKIFKIRFCLYNSETLYLSIDNEVISACEIVIIRNKEDAEKEIKECEKNINFYQNILKEKKINILEKNVNENLLFQEKKKKEEYNSYFSENF
jgi:hypothetical protein